VSEVLFHAYCEFLYDISLSNYHFTDCAHSEELSKVLIFRTEVGRETPGRFKRDWLYYETVAKINTEKIPM